MYELDDQRSSECPVSIIHSAPEAMELVQIVNGFRRLEAAGPVLPAHRIPGRIADAMSICQAEIERAEAAMQTAVMNS